MAIIKCKMCGGDIVLAEDKTYGTCEYCGSTMTFPRVSDEQRLNLFNRANHFRRQNEFDKAIAAYDKILDQDDTDAEAHWGAVLSRYGIEYVEDPVTHERIPTCHRVQLGSILTDADYLAALEHAPDTASRDLYESEAKRIADIQKGILAISAQEKPYDVFICYKETDDNGSRTKDSTLAQDIYYQLTNEGYKVFFSRITLEDKLGQQYEPYIFAALNSAKVMLVIGTKAEYFNAVWVKNEWNRYLDLMKRDRNKLLIPCYRDMDPYDLPEELSALQSQDMSKIGFMQDIIRGVKKVLNAGKEDKPAVVAVPTAGPGVASLHKRAVLFLEDGDWDSANEYFDRILDIDPEYAPAYIGKVQVTNKVRKEEGLARCSQPLKVNPDYQKALRFASEQQKAIYEGYNRAIEDRLERERKEAIYREADALEKRAATETEFITAAKKYDDAGEIRDAKERAANCRAKAASAKQAAERQAEEYRKQLEREREERKRQEEEARKEAERKAEQERIEAEKRAEQERIEAEKRARQERIEAEKRRKRNRIVAAAVAAILVVTGGALLVNNKVIQPKNRYNAAQSLLEEGKYDEAAEAFTTMGGYSDSADKVREAHYAKAVSLLNAGKIDKALESFKEAGDYSDTAQQIKNIEDYTTAEKHYKDSDYIAARPIYATLGNYLDSAAKLDEINKVLYAEADQKEKAGNLGGAYETWAVISDYSDCSAKMATVESNYQAALAKWENGDKTGAETDLVALTGWSDADAKLETLREEIADDAVTAEDYDTALAYYAKLKDQTEAVTNKITTATQAKNYQEAVSALDSSNLKTAYAKFVAAGDYSDAAVRAAQLDKYIKANEAMTTGAYSDARAAYVELGNFLDSEKNLETCNKALYDNATTQMESGDIAGAYETFSLISGYKDSREITAKVDSDYQAALDLWEKGDKTGAESALVTLAGWKDVDAKLETLREEIADDAAEARDYDTALTYYAKLANRTEALEAKVTAATQAKAYEEATAALASGDLKTAYIQFVAAGEHEDAPEQAANLGKYITANADMESGQYMKARTAYKALGDYLESEKNLEACNAALYEEAATLMENGDIAGAYVAYSHISDYSDSSAIAKGIKADYDAAAKQLEEGKYDEANAAFLALRNYSDSADQAKESLYQKAEALAANGQFAEATSLYTELGNYADSAEKVSETRYNYANAMRESGDLQGAAEEYEMLGEYSDAPQQLVQVNAEIANKAMEAKDYATALTAFQHLEQTDEIKAKEYELAQACYEEGHFAEATSAYEMLGQYELSLSKLPIARYAWADQLFNEGSYAEAAEQFAMLGEMTDSAERTKESIYQLAKRCLDNKEYDNAKSYYASIPGYSDADDMCKECDYNKATDLMSEGKNKEAETVYKALGDYSDSKTKAEQCIYNRAVILFSNGKFEESKKLFDSISYSDSATKAKQCVYNIAETLFNMKDYAGAKNKFASIDYLDSKERAKESAYQEAEALYNENFYADAETVFISIAGYNDSDDRAKDCHLQQGIVLMNSGDYQGALEYFESEEYEDSSILAAKCYFELGRMAHLSGKIDDAIARYAFAVSLPEVQEELIAIAKDYIIINEPEKAIQTLWLVRNREEANELLIEIAKEEESNGNANNALIAYSSLEHHPDVDFTRLIENTTYTSFVSSLDNYISLSEALEYRKYVQYKFAILSRDYKYYDLSIEAFTKAGTYEDASEQVKETKYMEAEYAEETGDQERAYSLFISLGEYSDSFERANKPYYDLGLSKQKEEKWDDAVTAFEHAGSYSDAPTQILITRYYEGLSEFEKEDWDGAYISFCAAEQYEDASEYAKECLYNKAKYLCSIDNYAEAFETYSCIRGYKDVDSIIQSNKKVYSAGRDLYYSQTFKQSSIVKFGRYLNNDIEWRILDKNGDEVLLISEYIIDYIPFNDQDIDIPWEKCTLRKWLNDSFLKTAFTDSQQSAILTKTHTCNIEDGNPDVEGKRIAGKATKDKVFIFSYAECKTYLNSLRKLPGATKYAASRNKYAENFWWLRNIYDYKQSWDSGHAEHFGSYLDSEDFSSAFVSNDDIGVRPAIWITSKAKVFEEEAKVYINTVVIRKNTHKSRDSKKASTEVGVPAKLVDGWYLSGDEKYAVQPSELVKKSEGIYSLGFKVRNQSNGKTIYDKEIEIKADGELTLASDSVIQDFTTGEEGKYRFTIVCEKKEGNTVKEIRKKISFKAK